MPTLNINEEQVLSLIDQLSSDQQTQILQKLFQKKQTGNPLPEKDKLKSVKLLKKKIEIGKP